MSPVLQGQKCLPLGGFVSFNGIAKRHAGQLPDMIVQKLIERRLIAFTNFAQHPANGLMDQVMRVV